MGLEDPGEKEEAGVQEVTPASSQGAIRLSCSFS